MSQGGDWLKAAKVENRFYRTPERDCDVCGATEGSVVVDREDDHETARCNGCLNDPDTWD